MKKKSCISLQPEKPFSYQHLIPSTKGKMRRLLILRESLREQLIEMDEQIYQEERTFFLCSKFEAELDG